MKRPPNLLILHAHDMGRYNSAYGHALPTPRMAQLATDGFIFRQAHCAAPTCSPSRAAMLTGRTAHEVGMLGLVHRGWSLTDPKLHLASWLQQHGYHTVLSGLQHELRSAEEATYSQRLETPSLPLATRDLDAAKAAADWLQQPIEQPFFLWTGLFLPHLPFLPADPRRFPAERMIAPPCLPDTPETRADWADYAASVERTDQCIGIVLDALRAGGHADNTVVVLTTDHGVPLPRMKCSLTGHGTGVTLIIHDPRQADRAGKASDALVSHLDLFPTLCDLLALPAPAGLHGVSLAPLMRGETDEVREDCFAEVNYHAAYEPKRSVRTPRWNYIRSFDPDRRRPLANIDDSRSKRLFMAAGWGNVPTESEELYDLFLDPQELRNLARDPAYAAPLEEMRRRLDCWLTKTSDPILHGPIPVPSGGKVNPRESVQPSDPPIVYP
jgi:N-sulfoglucosamine sulfohydrolase